MGDQGTEYLADRDGWFCTDQCDHEASIYQCEKPLHPYIDKGGRCACGLPRYAHTDGAGSAP